MADDYVIRNNRIFHKLLLNFGKMLSLIFKFFSGQWQNVGFCHPLLANLPPPRRSTQIAVNTVRSRFTVHRFTGSLNLPGLNFIPRKRALCVEHCRLHTQSTDKIVDYSKTPIYRASIYRVPQFTGPQFSPPKTSFMCKSM